jgi:hypothetical protein
LQRRRELVFVEVELWVGSVLELMVLRGLVKGYERFELVEQVLKRWT